MLRRHVAQILALMATALLGEEPQAKELYYTSPSKTGTVRPSVGKIRPTATRQRQVGAHVQGRVPNLGLRLRIEVLDPSGRSFWVTPSSPFFSGDHIRIHIESNVGGRLTILQKQDDGKPQSLFPDKRIRGGDDSVTAGGDTVIPLAFDDSPGRIRLFVYLRMEKSTTNEAQSKEDTTLLLAQAETMARSKGLRVDVDNFGPEPTMFAVRPASRDDPRQGVVAELTLDHRQRTRKQ